MILLDSESVWTWNHFFFGLTYAIVASLIFLFIVLLLFKPKIKICPFLCHVNNNGDPFYQFKFVNHSFFSAHDVKVELSTIRRIPMGGGNYNNEYKDLTLVNGMISHIPGRRIFWVKNMANPHCITVRSYDHINAILADDLNGITLKVSLKHGLTGLSKVFEQEYANEQDIMNGKFKPGTKFETL